MVLKISPQMTNSGQKEDSFAKLLGDFGKWQFLIFATVSLVKLSSGWVQMAILFLTPKVVFWCASLPNSTVEIVNSTCYKGCLEYVYDTSPFENTIVSEWDLVCERGWMASFTQMMLQVGILIGSTMFGFLSDSFKGMKSVVSVLSSCFLVFKTDWSTMWTLVWIARLHFKISQTGRFRYGRKHTFLIAITTLIIFGLAVPFSPNYLVFTLLRFFLGMATSGTMVVSFVIVLESVGPRYREVTGCLFQIPFIIGHMTVPLFAYYFRSWNTYLLALGIPPLMYLGYFFVLSESPRWLVSVGRVEEATRIVKKAALMNNRPTAKIEETLTQLSQEVCAKSDEPRLNYTALFQHGFLLKSVCCCIMWLIAGVTFFGFNQYISQTSPDPFISVALAGVIQIPSNLIAMWFIKKLGRKVTTMLFFILGGVFVIILYFVPKIFAVTLVLGTLGVSCAAIVATTVYIYTSELYPTVIRNMGLGAGSTAMRIGSMAAPFIANTAVTVPWLPTAIFGLTPIGAGLVCLLLPETKGKKLPDSIEDITSAS